MEIPDSGTTDLARSRTRSPNQRGVSVMDPRQVAALVVTEVFSTRNHLDRVLTHFLPALMDPRDKSLAREISYGVMRWYPRLEFISKLLLNKPLKTKDTDILSLIYVGLYQLMFLRIPDHAAISATVESAKKMQKPWACELVNAILRRYQRESLSIAGKINDSDVAHYAHPNWLITKLREQWPDHWQTILESNNQYPPLHLRLNPGHLSREQYLQDLQQAGIEARPGDLVQTGISITNPINVEDIPGFKVGHISVQDYGAQLAATLLDAGAGQRVLDACAAPGGKTAHIHERTPDLHELVAVEVDEERITLLRNTIDRLNLKVTTVHADVCDTASWWNGVPFDRILLDAPCSATGVIRRHPDIKYLRTPEQMPIFTATQCRMLESLWPLLKPGGRLVYVTCSMFREEGDAQIETFANKYDDTLFDKIEAEWGIESHYGRHTIPGYDDSDGFYYAAVTKAD